MQHYVGLEVSVKETSVCIVEGRQSNARGQGRNQAGSDPCGSDGGSFRRTSEGWADAVRVSTEAIAGACVSVSPPK
jgi:hypothetical protein